MIFRMCILHCSTVRLFPMSPIRYMWNYQYCTELMMPMSTNGKTDMFWEQPWSTEDNVKWCQEMFGITPRLNWAAIEYGGKKLHYASNIVFSNGVLDPWTGTGVTKVLIACVWCVLLFLYIMPQ